MWIVCVWLKHFQNQPVGVHSLWRSTNFLFKHVQDMIHRNEIMIEKYSRNKIKKKNSTKTWSILNRGLNHFFADWIRLNGTEISNSAFCFMSRFKLYQTVVGICKYFIDPTTPTSTIFSHIVIAFDKFCWILQKNQVSAGYVEHLHTTLCDILLAVRRFSCRNSMVFLRSLLIHSEQIYLFSRCSKIKFLQWIKYFCFYASHFSI